MAIFINPGSGPVADSAEENARAALEVFLDDLGEDFDSDRQSTGEDDGRWTYAVKHRVHEHDVEMPGLPPAEVRWMGEESGSIFAFPRLYVDGSSWVWAFALSVLKDCDDDREDS